MARKKKPVKAKEPVRIRFKKLQNGNKSIYLDIYREGKRVYEFLKLYLVPEIDAASRAMNQHAMMLAQKIKADRIIELTNCAMGISNSSLRSKTKIVDILRMYRDSLAESGKKASLHNVDSATKSIIAYRGDGVTLRQLDKDYCLGYMNWLRTEFRTRRGLPITSSTAVGYVNILSAAINFAVRKDFLKENPFDKIPPQEKIKRGESQREFLTIEELKKLIETPCPGRQQVKQAFLFSCYCGLRRGDVRELTWGQISKDGDQWRVNVVMNKTETPIYLPLSSQAVKWLPERGSAKDEHPVFYDLPSDSGINKNLGLWCKAAGLKKHVSYHVSRHTFATMMLTLDVDLYTTSKLLGHRNVHTTTIYAKIIDRKKEEAVNRVNDIFKD